MNSVIYKDEYILTIYCVKKKLMVIHLNKTIAQHHILFKHAIVLGILYNINNNINHLL